MSEYCILLCTKEGKAIFICVYSDYPVSHLHTVPRGPPSCVQWLDWRFVISLSFSVPSWAVIPLDPQRIPHLHPAGQKALCLPDNWKPLYLQGGLFGQWQLLLHRFQSIYFQECFLQLHPPCPSEWTLVSYFHFSFLSSFLCFSMQRWCGFTCMYERQHAGNQCAA